MVSERRTAKRISPKELAYIRFEPDGGGFVLNASEHGLAFHAAAPLRQSGTLHLCVSPNPEQRIQLSAEIAWLDHTHKSGGMRLREMPGESRDQIRRWLSPAAAPRAKQLEFLSAGWTTDSLHRTPPFERDMATGLPPSAALAPASLVIPEVVSALSGSRKVSSPARSVFPELRLPENLALRPNPGRRRGVAMAFLVLAFAFVSILMVQSFRTEFADVLIRAGEKIKGGTEAQAGPSPSAAAQPAAPGALPRAVQTDVEISAEQANTPAEPWQDPQARPLGPKSAEPNDAQGQDSAPSRQTAQPKQGRSALANQLWSKVEAGDSSAEVALAQLYLQGDGVPRNCEQARVLLRAASKKGNAVALQAYRNLNSAACR
jgi:hypothetical protein